MLLLLSLSLLLLLLLLLLVVVVVVVVAVVVVVVVSLLDCVRHPLYLLIRGLLMSRLHNASRYDALNSITKSPPRGM